MLIVGRSALVISLLVLVGCATPVVSPIRRISETLTMAENCQKIDQNVLDWYEAHPGKMATLEVFVNVEYEREPEASPYDEERTALKERKNEFMADARSRGEPLSNEAKEELRRFETRLLALARRDRQWIRDRNDRRRSEASAPIWAAALQQLRRIKEIESSDRQSRNIFLAPASALGRIAAIPQIKQIGVVGRMRPRTPQ